MTRVVFFLACVVLTSTPSWAAIVTGPWLQAATQTQMVVMWESSDNTAGSVDYGLTTSYGTNVASTRVTVAAAVDGTGTDTAAIIHTAVLTGFTANTLYQYRVTSGASVGSNFTFRTHKASGTWRIVHVSDIHAWLLSYTRAAGASILAYNPDYIIVSGDLANTSTNNDYRRFFQMDGGLFRTKVFYSAKGNHDDRTWTHYTSWFYNGQTGGADWGDCFASDCENYYSFDIGPVHFVGIDANQRQIDYQAGAVDWIEDDLAASTAQWKLVFMKPQPAITWTESASTNAQFLMPIFTTGGVDLVMTGGGGHHARLLHGMKSNRTAR